MKKFSMKLKIFGAFFLTINFLFILFAQKVFAKDRCPAASGYINENTVWSESDMFDGKFDCSETEVVIDGARLTLIIPPDLEPKDSVMETKSLKFKNGGDIEIQIKQRTFFEKQIDTLVETITKPYNAGQVVAGAGIVLQILSISTLLSIEKLSIASIAGIFSQVLFGSNFYKDLWGVVYDSSNSRPIPFAVIRLFDARAEQIISTVVTDLDGRYGFPVTVGTYFLKVEHDEFDFPSQGQVSKSPLNEDRTYLGGEFSVEEEASLDFSIPVDPKETSGNFGLNMFRGIWIKLKLWLRTGNSIFISFLFVLNLILTIFRFNIINFIFTLLYFFVIVMKFVSKLRKPQAWGIVYNSKTQVPVPSSFVKLYKEETNELMDTKITDNRGKYQFFVPKGDYLALVASTGYKFPSALIPQKEQTFFKGLLKVSSRVGVVNINVPIDPVGGVTASPFSG